MNIKDKIVLVTGATGFVGPYLVKELLKKEANVKLIIKDPPDKLAGLEHKISMLHGDITDPGSLNEGVENADIVFHLAAISNVNYAISHPKETFDINATGTANLLECARKKKIEKFVYISSSHIYGIPKYLPIDEDHPINPREPYSVSKAAAEMLVNTYALNYGLKTSIIRPFNMYGEGQSEGFVIPSIIKQAIEKEQVELGNLTPTRDFLYISDAIQGIMTIAESGEGTYNLGSGREISIKEVVQAILGIINPDKKFVSMQSHKRSKAIDIPRMCADISRIRKLGWSPEVDLKDGLEKTIKAMREIN